MNLTIANPSAWDAKVVPWTSEFICSTGYVAIFFVTEINAVVFSITLHSARYTTAVSTSKTTRNQLLNFADGKINKKIGLPKLRL